jgi:hypothetical protein
MDHPAPAHPVSSSTDRRARLLPVLFVFFLLLTVVCLGALRARAAEGQPPPRPAPEPVEYAIAR